MDRLVQKCDILLRAHFTVLGFAEEYDTYLGPVFRVRIVHWVLLSVASGYTVQQWILPFLSRWQSRLAIRKKIESERARRRANHDAFRRTVDSFMQGDNANTVAYKRALEAVEENPMKVLTLLHEGSIDPVSVLHVYQRNCLRAQDYGNPCTEFLLDAEAEVQSLEIVERGVRPLWGLILSVKESFPMRGTETTAGLGKFLGTFNNVAVDSTMVRAFRRLGGVVVTKTNVPQTLWSYTCSNPIYDYTAHPFNQARCPGGSSGGEACLLALNGSAIGIGTDGGGSVRIPAHFCGVAALKPTSARLGTSEIVRFFERSSLTNVAIGFLCRDVDLLVYAFRSIVEDGFIYQQDPLAVNVPWRENLYSGENSQLSENKAVLRGESAISVRDGQTPASSSNSTRLRIGWYDHDGYFPATPACKRAVHEAKDMLISRGHDLIVFEPPNVSEAFDVFMGGMTPLACEMIDDNLALEPNDVCVRYIPKIWRRLLAGPLNSLVRLVSERGARQLSLFKRIRTADHMGQLLSRKSDYMKHFVQAWKDKQLDVVICPAFGVTATPHDIPRDLIPAISYTCLYNLLDFPAGVVPITHVNDGDENLLDSYPTDDFLLSLAQKASRGSVGLPVGVQVVGKPFQEEVVLRIMRELQHTRREQQESGNYAVSERHNICYTSNSSKQTANR